MENTIPPKPITIGDSLREFAKQIQKERSAGYWLAVRHQATQLLPEIETQCQMAIKNNQSFLDWYSGDANLVEKLSELLEEEKLQVEEIHPNHIRIYWS